MLRFDVRQLKTCVLIDDGVRSVELSMDRRSMLVEKRGDYGCVELRAYKAAPNRTTRTATARTWTTPRRIAGAVDRHRRQVGRRD